VDPNQEYDKTRWVFEWRTTKIDVGFSWGILRGVCNCMAQNELGAMFCMKHSIDTQGLPPCRMTPRWLSLGGNWSQLANTNIRGFGEDAQ
jgi:hypothetical protein